MAKIKSINPSNGEVLGEVLVTPKEGVMVAIKNARKALVEWKGFGVSGRVNRLKHVVSGFSKRKSEFATLASKEMGMPISQSKHDIQGAIDYFKWYLENAERYLSPEVVYEDDNETHTVYREPVGVVAAITPWNFPASNFVWMCGQNLVSGNTVVFKESEEVPLCGKLIEEVVNDASLPKGVFTEIYGAGDVGNFLVHQDIDMICFTGSSVTGQKLYKIAAENFIKIFLELGGSAPGVVFEDANIDKVLETIYANRFDNCGQICDGLKRLVVHENIYDEVLSKLMDKLRAVKVGDANDESTEIGPLASKKQLDILEEQVRDAIKKGAKVEIGGKRVENSSGFFYEPSILTNIRKDMKVWREEVFGPVLPIVTFRTVGEAVDLANDTDYGLGGFVFTEDSKLAKNTALQIESGMVQVNNTSYVKPSSPFGGYKKSGIGREHGKFGFNDLTQVKLVVEER